MNYLKLTSLILLSLYITACSSLKGRLPPDEKFIRDIKAQIKAKGALPHSEDLSKKELWTHNWFLAESYRKNNKTEACPLYQKLALEEKFPLKLLADQRAQIFCLTEASQLETFWNKNTYKASWLKQDYLEISYAKAKEFKLSSRAWLFSKELARYRKSIPEKVDLYKEVFELAQINKDLESEKKVLEQLTRLSPSEFKPDLKTDTTKTDTKDALAIAKDLEKKRQFDEARLTYYKIINNKKSSFKEKMQAYERIRQCYRLERNDEMYVAKTEELITYLKKLAKSSPKNEDYLEALTSTILKRSRLLWNKHFTLEAEEFLLQNLDYETIPDSVLIEVYFVLGQMNVELNETEAAVEYLSLAEEIPSKDLAFKDKINWNKAWLLLKKLKRPEDAIENLLKIEKQSKDRLLVMQSLFWRAMAYKDLNKTKEANDTLTKLLAEDPFGYYGILAHKELKIAIAPLDNSTLPKTPFFDSLEWLIAYSEYEAARAFVEEQVSKTTDKEQLMTFFPLYVRVGKFSDALDTFYKWEVDERNDALNRLAPVFFPQPYSEIVQSNAQKNKIRPEWIYAIMRQESGFNAGARSPSDAFGLMQLIPETAKTVSRENKLDYKDPKDLYVPETNIALGSALLKKLKMRFNNLPMAIASYNAGHNAVEGWKKRYDNDDITFVENIPYSETQRYVKLVYRNLINYLRLTSSEEILLGENPFEINY